MVYDLRSKLIHTGDPDSTFLKKIKRILRKENSNIGSIGATFNFIKNYLEQIIRDTLKEFKQRMCDNNKCLAKIAEEIDKDILINLL